ncbi:MAG: cupin domain-containing protein [Deltaproteobacteria bacterium]|nr:cupin domain-containing protein [Deltaproteobacteria bacterium]
MNNPGQRPPFIISAEDVEEKSGKYPNSEELLCYTRRIGRAAGLLSIGINLVRLPPGHRTSWPHAEEKEEEFVYLLEGQVDAWIDGTLHPMKAGDLAAFPAGTGICHTFINNGDREAKLLVGGDADRSDNRIYYPLHPQRRGDMPWSHWWDDVPERSRGPHDGQPNALRRKS